MMAPSTSTVTFMIGSPTNAAEHFRKRCAEIVAKNPWLASILDTDPATGKVAAFYTDPATGPLSPPRYPEAGNPNRRAGDSSAEPAF